MKTAMLITILLMLLYLLGAEESCMIFDKQSKLITVKQMAENLKDKDVIFFGEYHGEAISHQLELKLLIELYALNPKIIVSLEMFERDVQEHLDNYLKDKITEEDFLAQSRPWPNYAKDYRPLVEFAKQNGLTVLAANVPRRYAALIAKNGITALDELPPNEKEYISENLVVLNDEYKRNFIATISGSKFGNEDNGAPTELLDKMYAAQCLKDDTMAESIIKALDKNADHLVIHYNGDFHSRKYLGTVQKVQLLAPDLSIAVISPVYADKGFSGQEIDINSQDGDYFYLYWK